jgi:flavin reductase (DIM6/NTAB) family NADH-FMN oxidoreductase RutF
MGFIKNPHSILPKKAVYMSREIILNEEDFFIPGDAKPVQVSLEHRLKLIKVGEETGIFISAGKTSPNIMSSHWGAIGTFWNRHVFILPIRQNKYTHRIIEKTRCFAVSVPYRDMRSEIINCERLSGFDVNKFEELHLHPARAKKIPAYTVSECGLFFECRVIYEADTTVGHVAKALHDDFYKDDNFHTMYFAEIIAAYENQ